MRARWKGIFFLSDEKRVPGELKVDHNDGTSEVTLWDLGDLKDVPEKLASGTLQGVVWQGHSTKVVSAFDCQVAGRSFGFLGPMYRTRIVFTIAAFGRRGVVSGKPFATAAEFLFDGFEKSYPVSKGFEAVMQPDAELKAQVERSVSTERCHQFKLGDDPVIGFYDGAKSDLTISGTVLGDIEINARSVTIPSGEPLVKNGPFIRLKFDEPVSLLDAYRRLSTVRYFIGLVIGYVPRLTEFNVGSLVTKKVSASYDSYDIVVPNDRVDGGSSRQVSVGMSLLNHITRKDEFSIVARNWLSRNQNNHRFDSNSRLLRHFGKNSYNEDRLIGTVNMFDLLPPFEKRYSNNKDIKDVASVIKRKAEPILKIVGDDVLPRLDYVIECAVNGRNHYTHGTQAKVDFRAGKTIIFLTAALEFIYGVAEMLACGWSLRAWLDEDHGGRHPFGVFLREYKNSLGQLDAASK